MTGAASAAWLPALSSIDQSLDEVRAVDDVSEKLTSIIRDVRGVVKLARALPSVAAFVVAFVRQWPLEFASTDDVWFVAEVLEPYVFEIFVRFGAPVPGVAVDVEAAESIGGLDADLSCRLAYVQTLSRQLSEQHSQARRPLDPRAQRAQLQEILDDADVPPEVRLVLHHSRLLPVLILLEGTTRRMTKQPGRSRQAWRANEMIEQALREGLDSIIGFLLALVQVPPAPAPPLTLESLPEPMPLAALDERWRQVRRLWTATGS